MLKIKNISYVINNKTLIDNISVDFEKGRMNLIIGPNGAGKSTLVKLICNQIQPKSGNIYYENVNLNTFSTIELSKIRAVLSQHVELAFPLKVREVVMMGRYPHFITAPARKDQQACEEAMHFFNVWDLKDRDFMTLSGGEKQRVHFARVIAQIWFPIKDHCRYLILDEPLTFLDVRYQFEFMHNILDLLKNKDIVVVGVVHDLNLAAKFADHIVLLNEGKILACGDKYNVLSKENIKNAYHLNPIIHLENNDLYLFFN